MSRSVSPQKQYTCTNYQDAHQWHDSSETNEATLSNISSSRKDTQTGKQNKQMQAGVKQNMRFTPSCNSSNKHEIRPLSQNPCSQPLNQFILLSLSHAESQRKAELWSTPCSLKTKHHHFRFSQRALNTWEIQEQIPDSAPLNLIYFPKQVTEVSLPHGN